MDAARGPPPSLGGIGIQSTTPSRRPRHRLAHVGQRGELAAALAPQLYER
jgi:hypothetical protein